jgi:hypothetical protein
MGGTLIAQAGEIHTVQTGRNVNDNRNARHEAPP